MLRGGVVLGARLFGMTGHNLRMLDIYTDYLLSSFGATTATGLSRMLPEVSHDQITRFLSQPVFGEKELWFLIKAQVRSVESDEGVLIVDDSVQEKPYSDESELITWHYDHSVGRVVKGINLLSALYYSQDTSLPVAFEVIQKTQLVTDERTGKDKWVSPVTKNESARLMIERTLQKPISFRYVLADAWFACADTMNYIVQKAHKQWIRPLKANRRVALSEEQQQCGRYLRLDLSACAMLTLYQKRWKVEEYHKSRGQNAALAKAPTKLPHTQQNHIFAALVAFCKLEAYRTQTHLGHFALKAKLYQAALQSAFEQLLECLNKRGLQVA